LTVDLPAADVRQKDLRLTEPDNRRAGTVMSLLSFIFLLLAVNVAAVYFIRQEKYIYFWDYSGYWNMYKEAGDLFRNNPLKALGMMIGTVRNDDYNLLPLLLLMPFNLLFGKERLPYILSVINVYAIPVTILFFHISRKIIETVMPAYRPGLVSLPVIATLAIVLLPNFWSPILYGYPDVAGVVFICCVILIYLKKPFEELEAPRLFALGVLLCLMIMTRRWYAYWVVSFFLAVTTEGFIFHLRKDGLNLRNYAALAKNVCIVGLVAVSFFFLCATPAAKRMLLTDYADIYSAYRRGPVVKALKTLGPLVCSLVLAGFFLSILKGKTARLAIFVFVQLIAAFLLFVRVQNFSSQHYYILVPGIAILISLFVVNTVTYLKSGILKAAFIGAFIGALAVNFSFVFIPETSRAAEACVRSPWLTDLFSARRHYPLRRNDIAQIKNVVQTLGELDKNVPGSLFYIVASSYILNDDIIRNACTDDRELRSHILRTHHVDRRDGFPTVFFNARYVVVADPVQYHLRPADQRVIGMLADRIAGGAGFGAAYKKLPFEFTLDGNVKVHIYERQRPVRDEEIAELSGLFARYYH
jgi:hypothetical protein